MVISQLIYLSTTPSAPPLAANQPTPNRVATHEYVQSYGYWIMFPWCSHMFLCFRRKISMGNEKSSLQVRLLKFEVIIAFRRVSAASNTSPEIKVHLYFPLYIQYIYIYIYIYIYSFAICNMFKQQLRWILRVNIHVVYLCMCIYICTYIHSLYTCISKRKST